jgi:4-amino-4-deoxychorismate lyase
MCRLIETIKCKDGRLFNLPFHQSRFNLAGKEIFGITEETDLKDAIRIPPECSTGLFRCRVIYSKTIEKIEFLHHEYRQVRRLKLVEDNKVDYRYKFANRQYLEELFSRRGDCDDILIVKNGCITDSFTANVVFYDGSRWWTPDTPLLAGTQRARLLHEGKIAACRITLSGLNRYKKAGLINAMQDLDEMPVIGMEKIFPTTS